jgi:hypothetical protein
VMKLTLGQGIDICMVVSCVYKNFDLDLICLEMFTYVLFYV